VSTFGYSFIYIAFSLLLILFLLTKDINDKLNRLFSKYLVTAISKVGIYSYCIYIVQTLVGRRIRYWDLLNPFGIALYFLISILLGMLVSETIERFFLKLRDKRFPKRIK
jgi:peptidoglycan/LPS O-acetylase OafA/YrhL